MNWKCAQIVNSFIGELNSQTASQERMGSPWFHARIHCMNLWLSRTRGVMKCIQDEHLDCMIDGAHIRYFQILWVELIMIDQFSVSQYAFPMGSWEMQHICTIVSMVQKKGSTSSSCMRGNSQFSLRADGFGRSGMITTRALCLGVASSAAYKEHHTGAYSGTWTESSCVAAMKST